MKKIIEYLVQHLVDKPDEVRVNEVSGGNTVIFELHVGEGDIGKVIGKHGQTAQSLRTILSAVSAKNGQHSFLEIMDDKQSADRKRRKE
jgi:uncharacterized protein